MRLSTDAEIALVKARIVKKQRARQSVAADHALLIRLTNKKMRAEIRARRKGAA